MIKRLDDITNITRNNTNTTTVYRGNVLIWPTQTIPTNYIYVVGQFTTYDGNTANAIVKLSTNGVIDTSFNSGGDGFSVPTEAGDIFKIDNRLIVVGNFTGYNNVLVNRIVALNLDGSRDTSFVTGIGFNSLPRTINKQSSGKLIIGGQFSTYNGLTSGGLVRINSDGSKDATFVGGFTGADIYYVGVYSDDKMIIAGNFSGGRMRKLNADGSTDTSFSIGTGFNNIVFDGALQTDDKIIAVGFFTSLQGVDARRVARVNTDGTIDTTFNNAGTGFNNNAFCVTIQPNGKILVGGEFATYNGISIPRIVRLNTDGTLDTTFNGSVSGIVRYIKVLEDGKILVGGGFSNGMIRLNSDGSVDTSFNVGTGFNFQVNMFVVDQN
jgi:uncharacterized delta-60 repeat protein